jgi:uncharacterized protein with von Willebrand factor type A (vWA) domain
MVLHYNAQTKSYSLQSFGNYSHALCYVVSDWDTYNWDAYLRCDPKAEESIHEAKKDVHNFSDFSDEVFHRLFSPPEEIPVEQVKKEHQWAVNAHAALSRSENFAELSRKCLSNRYLSGVGSSSFIQKFVEEMPKPSQRLENLDELRRQSTGLKMVSKQIQQKLQELQQQQQELQDQIQQQPNQQPTAEQQHQQQQLQQQQQSLKKKEQQVQQQLQQVVEQGKAGAAAAQEFAESMDESAIAGMVQAALEAANGSVDDAQEAMDAFGWGSEPGKGGEKEIRDSIDFARRIQNNRRLKKIVAMAGRLQLAAARKQESKSLEARNAIHSVEQGNDISRLLPSSLMLSELSDEMFGRKYIEGELLQFSLGGKEKLDRGPIVFCVDDSGSMEGVKEEYSKAILLAMAWIARKQRREFVIIHFDSSVKRIDEFPAKDQNPNKLLQSVSYFSGGGTDFEAPIDRAIKLIKERKNGKQAYKKADIVMLTDGFCNVSEDWKKRYEESKKECQFSAFALLFLSDHETHYYKQYLEPITKLFDKSVQLNDRDFNKHSGDVKISETVFGI